MARAQSARPADTFGRYADCLLSRLFQSVACSQHHSLEQRMACKLLAFHDDHLDVELPAMQKHLSRMLGATRTYVTKTAAAFQARGLISYARGRIRVLDRAGLETAACACHLAIRNHYQRVLPEGRPADLT